MLANKRIMLSLMVVMGILTQSTFIHSMSMEGIAVTIPVNNVWLNTQRVKSIQSLYDLNETELNLLYKALKEQLLIKKGVMNLIPLQKLCAQYCIAEYELRKKPITNESIYKASEELRAKQSKPSWLGQNKSLLAGFGLGFLAGSLGTFCFIAQYLPTFRF